MPTTPEVIALEQAVQGVCDVRLRGTDDAKIIRVAIRALGAKLTQSAGRNALDYTEVAALRKAGLTHKAIGQAVGCSESNVRRILSTADDPRPRTPRLDGDKYEATRRHEAGDSYRTIGEDFGVSHATVARWVREIHARRALIASRSTDAH